MRMRWRIRLIEDECVVCIQTLGGRLMLKFIRAGISVCVLILVV